MEYEYLIGVSDSVDSVSNSHTSLTCHHSVQRLLNFLLVLAVESWSCFVQKKNIRMAKDHSCNGYSLLLTSWNMWALDTHIFVETCAVNLFLFPINLITFFFLLLLDLDRREVPFKLLSFWVEVTFDSSSHNFFLGCFESVVLDVFSDSVVEKSWLLADHTKTGSQVVDIIFFNVNAINQDLSFVRIIESLEQLMYGWFSTARRTNKTDLLPFLDLEV